MIFLAFLLPLGVYLLLLGALHRRARPFLVSGTTDLIGLLFAASGFLLATGPGIIAALAERSRSLWSDGAGGGDAVQWTGLALSVLYFGGVVAGVVLMFAARRRLTAVYNVEPDALEAALATACHNLGLSPTRSGNLYVFGAAPVGAESGPRSEAIQAPHRLTGLATTPEKEKEPVQPVNDLVGQSAILEAEPFPALRHATLRWDPADALLRREVEAELERVLAETATPPSDLGGLLTLAGLALLVLTLVAGLVLLLLRHLQR